MKLKNGKLFISMLLMSISFLIGTSVVNQAVEVHANAELPFWGEAIDEEYHANPFTDEGVTDKIEELGENAEISTFGIDGNGVGFIKDKTAGFLTGVSAIIFGLAVIMVVFAGFKYATSEGDSKRMEQAKMQIIVAGIGIGIAVFNYVIVLLFKEVLNTGF